MKFTILLFALACFCSASALDLKATWEKYKQYYEVCKKDHNVDYETFKSIFRLEKEVLTQDEKCLLKCFINEKKALTETGEFDLKHMNEGLQEKFEGEDLKKAEEIIKSCIDTVPKENLAGCDYVPKVMKCAWDNGKKAGIKKPEFKD